MNETTLKKYEFYSQQGEDIFVFRNFLNKKCDDGVFVEVGAYDGVSGSNTKFFEDNLGYKGILIEPQTQFALNIVSKRLKSIYYPFAIHPHENKVKFIGHNAAAGACELMSAAHKSKWFSNDSDTYYISAMPLFTILKSSNITYIDFLSIDVEGGELSVLQSIHWSAVEIFIICIELDETQPTKDDSCRKILDINGFVFQHRIGNNDIWVNLNYSKQSSRCGTFEPYDAHFNFLNKDSIENLPKILGGYTSPFASKLLAE